MKKKNRYFRKFFFFSPIFHSIRVEGGGEEHRVHRFCIVGAQFSWGDLFLLQETSCNLPTYINTMLRFAFPSPYEPLHCTSSRKMRERGADGAGPSPPPLEGRWVAKKGRELRVGNPILRRSPLGISMYRAARVKVDDFFFFLNQPSVSRCQMIPRNGEISKKRASSPPNSPFFLHDSRLWRRHGKFNGS